MQYGETDPIRSEVRRKQNTLKTKIRFRKTRKEGTGRIRRVGHLIRIRVDWPGSDGVLNRHLGSHGMRIWDYHLGRARVIHRMGIRMG